MAISESVKLNSPWELGNAKTNTSGGKEFYEEGMPLSPHVTPDKQFGETLPETLPVLQFGETDATGLVKRVRMALTLDNSVPGRESWFAVDPWQSGWSSGSYDLNQMMSRWLSTADRPFFGVKLFGGTNGDTEIPPLDNSSPVFTARAGLARFVDGGRPNEAGTAQSNSIWIEGYYYTGLMLDEVVAQAGDAGQGGRERVRTNVVGTKDGINLDFTLPSTVDTSAHYEVQYNGVGIEPSNDYTVDGSNPNLLHLVDAPDSFDTLDVIFYPMSN